MTRPVYRIGGTVIPKRSGSPAGITQRIRTARDGDVIDSNPGSAPGTPGPSQAGPLHGRTIRFPDEQLTKEQSEANHQTDLAVTSE